MLIWKTLHILSMVTMVTVFIGAELFYAAALAKRDVRALAWVQRTLERTGAGIIGVVALAAGVVFGLLAAATGGFDFTATWLLVAYALVAAFLVNAAVIGTEVVHAGKAAIAAEEGTGSIQEVADSLRPNRGTILVAINAVLFTAIILDMTLKPF